jgi:hypothetical protein
MSSVHGNGVASKARHDYRRARAKNPALPPLAPKASTVVFLDGKAFVVMQTQGGGAAIYGASVVIGRLSKAAPDEYAALFKAGLFFARPPSPSRV